MKLGIGLIIAGTVYLTDAVIQMALGGWPSAGGKLIIGGVLLIFGIRRAKGKGQKEVQG